MPPESDNQLLLKILEQGQDFSADLKAVVAQLNAFALSDQAIRMEVQGTNKAINQIVERLEHGTRTMEALRESISEVQHVQSTQQMAVENVTKRDEDHLSEISNLWVCSNKHSQAISNNETMITTMRQVAGWITGFAVTASILIIGYFANQVIDTSKNLAVIESKVKDLSAANNVKSGILGAEKNE